MDDDGGWTVVRGKGKGRFKGTSLKRARDECCPGGSCTATPYSVATPGSASAAAGGGGGDHQPPPPPPASHGGGCDDGSWPSGMFKRPKQPSRGGGGRGRGGERSPAEQCEQLLVSIRSCGQEVSGSPFFARLLTVMKEAAEKQFLDHLPYSSPIPHTSYRKVEVEEAGASASDGEGVTDDDAAAGNGGDDGKLARWRCIRHLVVYGLGSPHNSRVSRYQLSLVLLLRDEVLSGLTSAVQLYDPAFDNVDRLALQQLGLQVLEEDEGAARTVTEPSFFYMPHCEEKLYDALLRANWNGGSGGGGCGGGAAVDDSVGRSGGLSLLALLGNSFREYVERWEMRRAGSGGGGGGSDKAHTAQGPQLRGPPGPVVRCCLEGAVKELTTPDLRFPVASAFNSTALHLFPPSYKLERLLATGPDDVVMTAEEAAAV